MSAKTEYQYLLDQGELLEMYQGLTGQWEKDEKKFTKLWQQNIDAINNIDTDYEEY